MKQIVRLAAVFFAMVLCTSMYAQTRVISGTVKDENGKPLPFLAVQVKGTTIGTYTDTAGKFSLTVDQTAKTLVLSYPGMKTQESAITDNMTITMSADVLGLNELVVTAVGITAEKKSLGYATQEVNSDQLNTSGTSNVMNELEGKVSGLSVVSSAGDPGAGTNIVLRGVTSLTGNNQPLIVVDGVPIDNSINNYDPTDAGAGAGGSAGNLTSGTQPTNRGLDINPSDIESINVLKGPAATALYGINAASGAIVITTKKGKKGGTGLGIEFNSSLTWSTYNKLPDRQDQWTQGTKGLWYGPPSGAGRKFSWGAKMDTMYWTGTPNEWFKDGSSMVGQSTAHTGSAVTPFNAYNFFQTGVANDNNIAVSGGTDRSSFRMSLGNLKQTGIIPGSDYRKTSFNINGSSALSKKLSVSAGIDFVNSTTDKVQQGSNISSVMLGLLRTPPTFDNSYGQKNPVDSTAYVTPSGGQRDFRGGPGYDNPYWTVNRNPFISKLNRVFGYGMAEYIINDWIRLRYRIGGDAYWQDDKNAYDIGSNAFSAGAIFMNNYFNSQYNSDAQVIIDRQLNDKLKLNAILGQNFFQLNSSTRFAEGTGFIVPDFLDMSNATSYLASEGEAEKRTSAYYADITLAYASQLYFNLTTRSEISSTLPSNSDRFFYPSVSVGWVFTEFLHMSTNKILPYGKIRFSWAQVGKDAPISALQNYYHVASIVDGFTTGIQFPYNGLGGYELGNPLFVIGNSTLQPEKTNSTEIGLDLAFLQNKIKVSATYYSEDTHNEIFTVPVPYSTGFGAEIMNAGEITNKGIELTLDVTPVNLKNGFRWDLSINYSHNANEVVTLANGVKQLFLGGFQNGGVYAVPGMSYGQIYGNDYSHADGGAVGQTTGRNNLTAPLLINDNPGGFAAGQYYPYYDGSEASQALANTLPKWIGGLTSTFSFKGLSLGIVMTTRQGGYMWDGTLGAMEYFGTAQQTANRDGSQVFAGNMGHINAQGQVVHWDPTYTIELAGPGAANTTAAPTNQNYWQNIGNSFTGPTNSSIFNASYTRISQISLAYELPKKIIEKAHFTRVAITVFANNPVLWTKYPGVDPETSLGGPANGQGLDYFNNPNSKSYGVRLNVGL